jgi:hypothetical protein
MLMVLTSDPILDGPQASCEGGGRRHMIAICGQMTSSVAGRWLPLSVTLVFRVPFGLTTHKLSPHTQYDYLAASIGVGITHTVGLMFALRRKKLRGSYLFFKATRRS